MSPNYISPDYIRDFNWYCVPEFPRISQKKVCDLPGVRYNEIGKTFGERIMNKKQIETAIQSLKERLVKLYGHDVELRIFGSVAKDDYHEDSDIDILVVLPSQVNNAIEEQVFDLAYDIELEYGVIIGTIVYSKEFWYSEQAALMPLYKNIQREGLSV
jgi:predicted nucleotidyltransferase